MRSVHPTARLVLLGSLSALAVGCGGEREEEVPPGSRDLIDMGIVLADNGEDGDNSLLEDELGWLGYWYTYDDKLDCVNTTMTGTTTPLPEPQGGDQFTMTAYDAAAGFPPAPPEGKQTENNYGARFFGGGHATATNGGFGAGIGFGLNGSAGVGVFDLTAAGVVGLRFMARNGSGMQAIDVKIKDAWSEPAAGKCIPRDESTCMPDQGCHDDPQVSAILTDQWQPFEFTFDKFTRAGWSTGYNEAPTSDMLVPSQAYQVQFQVPPVEAFDIWIDNVGFILDNGSVTPVTPSIAPTTAPAP